MERAARNDIEIFKLVDTDGLTPLLMVLNEPSGSLSSKTGETGKDGTET